MNAQYKIWLKNNVLTEEILKRMRNEINEFRFKPKISILMSVYGTDEKLLKTTLDSVIQQIYSNWELCVVISTFIKEEIKRVLETSYKNNPNIKIAYVRKNSENITCLNDTIKSAHGEFIGFLNHADELTADALYHVVKLLNACPDMDCIYTDEDKKDLKGRRSKPFFKPNWSPDLLFSMNYIGNFIVIRKRLLNELGGLREGYNGSVSYDLVLRLVEITDKISHIAEPLYNQMTEFKQSNVDVESNLSNSAKKALSEALIRRGINGKVLDSKFTGAYRIRYDLDFEPLVSIIILTRDKLEYLRKCIDGIRYNTDYKNYELIVIDNNSEDKDTIEFLNKLPLVVRESSEFNASKLHNIGAKYASGKYLLLLNNDIEIIDPSWLKEMVSIAERDDVGIVGAKLLFPDSTVQHAGAIIGLKGTASHAFYRYSQDDLNYHNLLNTVRNCSAVTGACMLVKRKIFDEVKGFDENIHICFGDTDFCLRAIRDTGTLIVYTPYAKLLHYESITRASQPSPQVIKDVKYFRHRWKKILEKGDPYYNPNLSLEESYKLGITPGMIVHALLR